jgi:hypothetical protein
VSVLLRQAGGFEGLGLVHDALHPNDLLAPEGEELEVAIVALDPACSALAVLDDLGQDGVARGAEVCRLNGELFPLLEKAAHVIPDPIEAEKHTELWKVRPNDEQDVLIEIVNPGSKISLSPGFVDLPHDLHVLLRHRPRSIAQSQADFEGERKQIEALVAPRLQFPYAANLVLDDYVALGDSALAYGRRV